MAFFSLGSQSLSDTPCEFSGPGNVGCVFYIETVSLSKGFQAQ